MKLSQQLLGKQVTFNSHHNAFPSNFFKGEIIKVEDSSCSYPQVRYTVQSEDKLNTFDACLKTVTDLVNNSRSESGGHMWSQSETNITIN